jgi:acetolactate synthase-1/2/3 large subunit
MNNYLDCGEAVLQALRCLDIDYVMASPGSEWGPVWEAFARQKLGKNDGPTLLNCAHETLAADLAVGYTAMTGRMQAVMLHTGVGLLQGAMGIAGAHRQNMPMVVISGESLTFGDQQGFDPGHQWVSELGTPGGPQRLAEPFVKWSIQASSAATMFQQIINAGELAQRTPAGPVFVSVPIENMIQPWQPPASFRQAPRAPRLRPADADLEQSAALLAKAENPLIIAEAAGRDADGYHALVALAELLQIPVIEAVMSDHCNFPKDHHLHQGIGRPPLVDEADVVLTPYAAARHGIQRQTGQPRRPLSPSARCRFA